MKLCAAVAAAMLVGASSTATAAPQAIKLNVTSVSAASAPYFIAIDKGYFAAQSLAVTIVDAGGGIAVPALIHGSIDFSMSAAVAVGAELRGAPLRVIYTMADRPVYELWSTDPAVKSLADLKGRQIGINTRGDSSEIAMRISLRDRGLPSNFVGFTALGSGTRPRIAALASGAMPAVTMTRGELAPLQGTPAFARAHMILDLKQSIRMPYTGIATSERILHGDPALARRFLRAVVEGVLYMRAYKQQTIDILMKAEPTGDRAEFARDYDDLLPTLTADGAASDDLIRKDLAVRADIMGLAAATLPPPSQLYDYGPLRDVAAVLKESGWKPTP